MISLIQILFIAFSPLVNNQIDTLKGEYIQFDSCTVEIVFDSLAETPPESYISNSFQTQDKKDNPEIYFALSIKEIFTRDYPCSFLNRLLPFLIDVPPPL